MKKLEVFHNRCLRGILGISTVQQRRERITTIEVRRKIALHDSLEGIIMKHRLRWLGHVARMSESRIPKQLLFGWLPQPRPAHGPRKRWRDRVQQDLKCFNIDGSRWFELAQDRAAWRLDCRQGLAVFTQMQEERDTEKRAARCRRREASLPPCPKLWA